MSPKQLRQTYSLTHSSWRNRKHECKKNGGTWSPEFEDFVNFLRLVGPRTNHTSSLDRIDNSNPDYGPGLVKWNDKRGQANNRSSTIYLTYAGQRLPLTVWADKTNQSPATLRARMERGWSDSEVIEGRRRFGAGRFGNVYHFNFWPEVWPDRPNLWRVWEGRYHRANQPMPRIAFVLSEAKSELKKTNDELEQLSDDPAMDTVRSGILARQSNIRLIISRASPIFDEAESEYKKWKRRAKRDKRPFDAMSLLKDNPRYYT